MASTREIKRRRDSIQSIQKITKAMKLVSTVKFQKSRGKAEEARPYFEEMYRTVSSILRRSGGIKHRYLQAGESGKTGILVISSNRGLAGGYNASVVRAVTESGIKKEETLIYPAGRKAKEALEKRGYQTAEDYGSAVEEPKYPEAQSISRQLLRDFEEGKLREIYLAYTAFQNAAVHEARLIRLLPVQTEGADGRREEGKPAGDGSHTVQKAVAGKARDDGTEEKEQKGNLTGNRSDTAWEAAAGKAGDNGAERSGTEGTRTGDRSDMAWEADSGKENGGREGLMEYEPGEEEVLDQIIPRYLTSMIFGALKESAASENGARMQAMDSATKSAEDMIGELSVKYNRARQASITQELTEIITGAESLSG